MTETARETWNAQAASFDLEADHGLLDPVTRAAWRALLRKHLPAVPARVADLGCGTGSLSVLLAEEGYDVQGLDVADEMVAAARAKAERHGVAASFVRGDAARPPYDAGSVDVVVCRHVLWALPDPAAALARWVDLLREGGRLVLVEGSWSTGAGLRADECVRLLADLGRTATVHELSADARLWGAPVTDERYLVASLG